LLGNFTQSRGKNLEQTWGHKKTKNILGGSKKTREDPAVPSCRKRNGVEKDR